MTYYAREYTDPAGGALTITTDHQGLWITATEGREEVTVGPFPATTLADDMDGGVTAALTEPPARPEGAEEIERLLTEDLGDFRPPVTPAAIADLLAARGVRVVTEEES